jgi:hypothetical protein
MADQANVDFQAAQTGVDPITGSILSSETRKLLFKRSRMSSSSFFGGGGGSAIVPIRSSPDPETLAIVKRDEITIQSLRNQFDFLRGQFSSFTTKINNDFFAALNQFSFLQNQINDLNARVNNLAVNLDTIAKLIQLDSVLEEQKARQEYEYEKQLAEQGARQGKEKLLEQRIQNALMAPVRAISNKVSGIFANLMSFMWQLLGGWLTIQGLNVLKALATGDKKTLEEIKNNVIKSLLVVGGTLLFIQFGLGKLIRSITKLAFNVGKFILENTIGRLFKLLGGLAKKALGLGGAAAEGAGAAAEGAGKPRVTMGAGTAEEIAKAGGKPEARVAGAAAEGGEGLLKGGAGLLKGIGGAILPIGGALLEGSMAKESADRGNKWAAGLHATSAALSASEASIIDIPFAWTGSLVTGLAGTFLDVTGIGDTKQPDKKPPPRVQPQNRSIPSSRRQPAQTQRATSRPTASITSGTQEPTSTPLAQTQSATPSSNAQTSPPPAQTQSMPTPQPNLGQPTEPSPQVVTLNAPQAQSSQTPQSSLMPGSATDIPLFPSANPDNFYSLYAQVNYNVIL